MPDNKPISETRTRILDVAERQFMANGFEGASMRMITREAGVNLAAVNYHFGSKENLLREVFRRRLSWLNSERLKRLDELEAEAGGGMLKPEQILDGLFGTLLRIGEDESLGGMIFLRLFGRFLVDPSEFIHSFFVDEHAGVLARYRQALVRALPGLPEKEIAWRMHLMLGAMSYAISDAGTLYEMARPKEDQHAEAADNNPVSSARVLAERLMPFLLGGLQGAFTDPGDPKS